MAARGSVQSERSKPLSARERRVARADRRERESAAAREAIRKAAEEIFARDGFDGARVDAIAEMSGYNKALLFHYFGDKLGLYHAVVCMRRDESEAQRTHILLALAGDQNAATDATRVRQFIETAVGWHFDHLVANPNRRRILAWEAAEGWDTLNEARRNGAQLCPPWVGPTVEFIRRAQAVGIIRKDVDPYMAMAQIKSMVLMHLLSLPSYEAQFGVDFSSPEALEHAREQMVSFAVHAFMAPAATTRPDEGI